MTLRSNPADVGKEVHIFLCDQLGDVCEALCLLWILKQIRCVKLGDKIWHQAVKWECVWVGLWADSIPFPRWPQSWWTVTGWRTLCLTWWWSSSALLSSPGKAECHVKHVVLRPQVWIEVAFLWPHSVIQANTPHVQLHRGPGFRLRNPLWGPLLWACEQTEHTSKHVIIIRMCRVKESWCVCCVSQYYSSVETVMCDCVCLCDSVCVCVCLCSYCAPGLLQLSGRHHGFELLTTQISKQCGLRGYLSH